LTVNVRVAVSLELLPVNNELRPVLVEKLIGDVRVVGSVKLRVPPFAADVVVKLPVVPHPETVNV
jgi:hypothetical protein